MLELKDIIKDLIILRKKLKDIVRKYKALQLLNNPTYQQERRINIKKNKEPSNKYVILRFD
jgi:hypothetical protein